MKALPAPVTEPIPEDVRSALDWMRKFQTEEDRAKALERQLREVQGECMMLRDYVRDLEQAFIERE